MTAPLTDADLAAARALAEGATPGPWQCYRPSEFPEDIRIARRSIVIHGEWNEGYIGRLTVSHVGTEGVNAGVLPPRWEDAVFMVEARTLVPRLCDAVEEARRERNSALQRVAALVVQHSPGEPSKWSGHAALVPQDETQFDVFVYVLAQSDLIAGAKAARVAKAIEAGVRAETAERERDEARARVEKLEALTTDYLAKLDYCLTADDLTVDDEGERDAAEQRLRALLSPTPSPEATPVEADTMAHEDAVKPCAACIAEGEANEDGSCSCGPECPDCAKGAR